MTPGEQTQAMRLLERAEAEIVEAQAGAWLTLGIDSLAHLFDEGWSVEDIVTALQIVLQEVQGMAKFNRRHLIQLGAAAVMSGVVIPTGSHVSAEDRTKLHQAFGESIAAGWRLFVTASIPQTLAVGQMQLHLLHQSHNELYPSVRPLFYSPVYRLIGAAYFFQSRYAQSLQTHT